jgi:FlaA1/EpsC-like NDP-sugar epimerase
MNLEKPMKSSTAADSSRDLAWRDLAWRDLAWEDLLGRQQTQLDLRLVREQIAGRVVLVTGAAGSIGAELCRQIAGLAPMALIGFDQAETSLIELESELCKRFPGLVFHSEIGNITRREDANRVMERHRPWIVFHAAAYKHVPMSESHPFAAVENNVFGTWRVAQAAIRHGVQHFVLISTDKAVRPASVMGVTKRVAELAIRALGKQGRTKFVAVRFGNVLGSSGSVAPIFREQIAAGGPVTVTHPEMKRYFMTASEAGQLVLQAFLMGGGGEIFVLDMGQPVSILDLARNLIRLCGLEPERDIKIEFSGIRPGEKLIEELSLETEHLASTSHARVRSIAATEDVDAAAFEVFVEDLERAVGARDVLRMMLLLKEMVPDYAPSSQILKGELQGEPAQPANAIIFQTPFEDREPAGCGTVRSGAVRI